MAKLIDVNTALDALDHPLREQIDEVRELTKALGSDVTEQWKWNAPTLSVGPDYLFTFHLRPMDYLHLVVHHPDAPTIASDLLEGDYADGRRMIYLRGSADLIVRRPELESVLLQLATKTRNRAASAPAS